MSYQCILADPPWEYDQKLTMADGVRRSSTSQYSTMSVQQVCDLYTTQKITVEGDGRRSRNIVIPGKLAGYPIADTALLGLWITAPFLLDGIQNRVCACWGFTPRQIVPWIKGRLAAVPAVPGVVGDHVSSPPLGPYAAKLVIQPGMGHLTRGCVEYLVLATRGKYTALVKSRSINGLLLAEEEAFIVEPKSKHSRKPNAAYSMLENLFPGPRLELFAREYREGWDAWGKELPNGPDFPAAYEAAPPDDVEIIEWP
jgi:N6-adenosine-specific RNA methylase IME4